MATATDLMGVGINAQAADILGNQDNTTTCAGTSSATATTVLTKNTELVAASSQTGAIISSNVGVGAPMYFFASASTSAVIYVPSGHYLNGTQNDSLTVAQNGSAIIWQYKKSYWASKT